MQRSRDTNKINYVEPVQRRGESDESFLRRVNNACEIAMQEASFEKKYGVEIKKDPNTGKVEKIVKREKNEIDLLMQKMRKDSKKKVIKKPKNGVIELRLTKAEKRKNKLKEKKERKSLEKIDDFDSYKDSVEFGEIVHAPPSLLLPKKGSKKVAARVIESLKRLTIF